MAHERALKRWLPVQKMCGGGMAKYSHGGMVEDDDEEDFQSETGPIIMIGIENPDEEDDKEKDSMKGMMPGLMEFAMALMKAKKEGKR